MKPHNIKTRYILSIIIDSAILFATIIPIIVFADPSSAFLYFLITIITMVIVLLQDKFFKDASIGKRIFSIKIVSIDNDDSVSFANVFVRRILEMMSTGNGFFRLSIDIDKISNTKIVHKSYVRDYQEAIYEKPKKSTNYLQDGKLRIQREKAFLFDLAIISWSIIITILLKIEGIKALLNNYLPTLSSWVYFSNMFISVLYFTLKDLVFGNASFGKKKYGIEVVDLEGKIPSRIQMAIRSYILLQLFPIEIILFLFSKRQIAEMITYTKVDGIK